MNHEKPTAEEIKLLEVFTGIGQFKKIDPNAKLKMSVPAIIAFAKYYYSKRPSVLLTEAILGEAKHMNCIGYSFDDIQEAARKECEQRIEENLGMTNKIQLTDQQLRSACLSYNHSFGFMTDDGNVIGGLDLSEDQTHETIPEPPKEIKDFEQINDQITHDFHEELDKLEKHASFNPASPSIQVSQFITDRLRTYGKAITEAINNNKKLRKQNTRLKKKLKKLKRAKSHVEMFDRSIEPAYYVTMLCKDSDGFEFLAFMDETTKVWRIRETGKPVKDSLNFKYCELPKGLKY